MEFISNNWIYSVMIAPILMGFFKSSISDYLEDIAIYITRKYDDDKNPATGQYCLIQSGATGQWFKIFIKDYKFGILPNNRIIITEQETNEGKSTVIYTYKQWKNIITGTVENPEYDLRK